VVVCLVGNDCVGKGLIIKKNAIPVHVRQVCVCVGGGGGGGV
jgi:hypothetical protein